jgi:hypothetical protein
LIISAVALQVYYLMDGNADTTFSIEAVMVALTGSGFLVARDNSVTSEEAVPYKTAPPPVAKKGKKA